MMDNSRSSSSLPIKVPINLDVHHDRFGSRPEGIMERTTSSQSTDKEPIVAQRMSMIVYSGLILAIFLAAMDQTIVVIALPTIIADLDGFSGYSWVGSAYMLGIAALNPLYGRLSDVVGRKPILLIAIALFLVGSALCGAAQSLTWLIISRGLQGVGGGGISSLVQIVISDLTTLEERGKYIGSVGTAWGVAAVLGPSLGGVLTDRASWRWTFFINLPIGGCAAAVLIFFLKLNPTPKKTFKSHISSFDFTGLVTIFFAMIFLLLGFNFAEHEWRSASTICCLSVAIVLLGVAVVVENFTDRNPIIPPRLFKDRNTALLLLSTFLHGLIYYTSAYYLPLYYQALGASATMSGVKNVTYSFGTGIFSVLGGQCLTKLKDPRHIFWICWGISTLGCGLMALLDENSSLAKQEIYPLVASLGIGGLFAPPMVALQAVTSQADLAASTSTLLLLRVLGGAIGVSIGQTTFASQLSGKLAKLTNALGNSEVSRIQRKIESNVEEVVKIKPQWVMSSVLRSYTESISTIWMVCIGLSTFGCLCGKFFLL